MWPGTLRQFHRVTRRLINVLTTLSVLAFAAAGALWVDAALRGGRGRLFGSTTDGVTFVNLTGGMQLVAGDLLATRFRTKQVREWSFPGFLYRRIGGPSRQHLLMVHHALALAAFALLPAGRLTWHALSRRRRHARRGVCRTCAYDLTGNLSGVCPECGTPAAATPA